MAAIRGSVGCNVFWVIILCSVLLLMLTVTVRGQTTQSGGTVHLSPGVRGPDKMMSILAVFISEIYMFLRVCTNFME